MGKALYVSDINVVLDFKFRGFPSVPPGSCGEGFGDGDSMGGKHADMSPS